MGNLRKELESAVRGCVVEALERDRGYFSPVSKRKNLESPPKIGQELHEDDICDHEEQQHLNSELEVRDAVR